MKDIEPTTKIAIFKGKHVIKTIFDDQWFFSVIDVISILLANCTKKSYS